MESSDRDGVMVDVAREEYRVQVTSKKRVSEQINRYKSVLTRVLDHQPDVPEDTKRALMEELLANFQAGVQDNVLVSGQTWDDAAEAEAEEEDVESLLDDAIVETTRRRRTFPRQILPHVVGSLRAERKLLELYEKTVLPAEVVSDPRQESLMNDLSAAAAGQMKHTVQVIQSINTLRNQAEGLREVVSMTQSPASLQIHQEVLGRDSQSDAEGRTRQPIKRAVEEAAAAGCYVPLAKDPRRPAEDGELQ